MRFFFFFIKPEDLNRHLNFTQKYIHTCKQNRKKFVKSKSLREPAKEFWKCRMQLRSKTFSKWSKPGLDMKTVMNSCKVRSNPAIMERRETHRALSEQWRALVGGPGLALLCLLEGEVQENCTQTVNKEVNAESENRRSPIENALQRVKIKISKSTLSYIVKL